MKGLDQDLKPLRYFPDNLLEKFFPLLKNYEPIKLRKLFRISYSFPSEMAKTTPSK